ncbi:acyl-CoA dehydrogenase family protein [Gordonia sp. NPDC003376]
MPPLLTPEQDNIREAVHDFADRRLADGYLARAKSSDFLWELHRGIAELGALGLLAGEKYNALGTEDHVTVGLVIEEPAAADVTMANAVIPVMLMSSLPAAHAEPECRTPGYHVSSRGRPLWRSGSPSRKWVRMPHGLGRRRPGSTAGTASPVRRPR